MDWLNQLPLLGRLLKWLTKNFADERLRQENERLKALFQLRYDPAASVFRDAADQPHCPRCHDESRGELHMHLRDHPVNPDTSWNCPKCDTDFPKPGTRRRKTPTV